MPGFENAGATGRPSVEVEVFSDFCCPFCLIGAKHLDDAIAALEGEVEVRTVHRPFELNPGAPAQGVDVRKLLMARHGIDAARVWPPLEASARASGIPLELARQPLAYPTLAAHTLVRHAAEKGTARALARAVGEAYFLNARAIADHAVLADIASRHGFAREAALALLDNEAELAGTREEAEAARRRGIRSVPTVVIAGQAAMSSSRPVVDLQDALRARSRRA